MSTPVVYIVEDDAATLEVLQHAIAQSDLDVQGFQSPRQMLEKCDPARHGCQILDVYLPGMSGLELRKELCRRQCRQPFIAITGAGDIGMAVDAMRSGAVDFLEKPFSTNRLLASVREAIQRDAATRTVRSRRQAVDSLLHSLTPRERQVMELVVAGQLTKQIASQLGISIKTVDVHRSNMIHKMGVKSTAQLVRLVTNWRATSESEPTLAT
jgi:FixJ family two-component response regulator